jgi:nicotinamide mononucleotide transporter
MTGLELGANAANAVSIVLAGRNSVHTWWTGIVGCLLFVALFYEVKLYADATLQVFFIVTSVLGWVTWRAPNEGGERAVQRTSRRDLALILCAGVTVTLGYGWVLYRFTDAYAPLADSAVLAFSAIAQLLLMRRCIENWWFWLLVNTVAVPLYISRGLYVTAALYAAFWINAAVSLRHWRRLMAPA